MHIVSSSSLCLVPSRIDQQQKLKKLMRKCFFLRLFVVFFFFSFDVGSEKSLSSLKKKLHICLNVPFGCASENRKKAKNNSSELSPNLKL